MSGTNVVNISKKSGLSASSRAAEERRRYPIPHIHAVIAELRGRRCPIEIDASVLEPRLMEIFERHGAIDPGDEFARLFQQLSGEEHPNGEVFRRIRDLAVELDNAMQQPFVRGRLDSQARGEFAGRHMRQQYPELAVDAQAFRFGAKAHTVLHMIAKLADRQRSYEAAQVREGRAIDQVIDDLLGELADLFIELRGSTLGRWDVAHSVGSVFIRFSAVALQPLFDPTQVSPKALSNRWSRIKRGRRAPINLGSSRSQKSI